MENPQWFTALRDYGGQKLAARLRPPSAISEADKAYSYLLVVTHSLNSVGVNGMPDPNYNDSLHNFDVEMIEQLEFDGRVVLVETHSGRRIYYAYVADENASRDRAMQVLTRHSQLTQTMFRGGEDPAWTFYARYTAGEAIL